MIGVLLSSLLAFAKDTGKVLFLLARQALLVARVVKGQLVAGLLMQARATLLQILLWGVLFALLQTAWIGLRFLFGTVADWTGLVSAIGNLAPGSSNQGVFHVVFRSLDLNSFFGGACAVFNAWLSGWGVYKSLEYAAAISSMTKARGFWGRI